MKKRFTFVRRENMVGQQSKSGMIWGTYYRYVLRRLNELKMSPMTFLALVSKRARYE